MNLNEILNQCKELDSHQLFRLKSAIDQLMRDPQNIYQIAKRCFQGMDCSYYEPSKNRLIPCKILELKRDKVTIRDLENNQVWAMAYYYLNLDNSEADFRLSQTGLVKAELKVGDTIGFFDNQNLEVYGEIARLNPKTVTIYKDHVKWRVPYSMLFRVCDGELALERPLIEILPPEK